MKTIGILCFLILGLLIGLILAYRFIDAYYGSQSRVNAECPVWELKNSGGDVRCT